MDLIDFSIDGMIRMQLQPSGVGKIHDMLMYETATVKTSLLKNLQSQPEKGHTLIRNFCFLVKKHVFITEKQIFFERWNMGNAAEIFALTRGRIDKSLVDELNESVYRICLYAQEELFDAYQDQRIDPIQKLVENRKGTILPFGYYLNFEKKDELVTELKRRFPEPVGVKCARMIIALKENDLLRQPDDIVDLYNSIKNEWNIKKFQRQGIDRKLVATGFYLAKDKRTYSNTEQIEIKYINDIRDNIVANSTKNVV